MIKYTKHNIVQAILKELQQYETPYAGMAIDEVISKWFFTRRSGDSLLLSKDGNDAFELAGIEYYDFELPWKNILESMIHLDHSYNEFSLSLYKKINCPYWTYSQPVIDDESNVNVFTTKYYLRVYDGHVAFQIGLYGDVESYLKSLDKD